MNLSILGDLGKNPVLGHGYFESILLFFLEIGVGGAFLGDNNRFPVGIFRGDPQNNNKSDMGGFFFTRKGIEYAAWQV